MGRFGFSLAMGFTAALVAILGVTVAICFACLSFYFYLATITTSALGVAGAALLLAMIALASISLIRRPRLGSLLPRKDEERLAEALKLGKTLGGEGRDFVQSNLSKASIAAFGVGLAMGLSPKLRKAILDLIAG